MALKIKQLIPMALLSMACFVSTASFAEALKLYATSYPPFDIDAQSGPRGFDVEVTEAAFSAAGIDVRVEFLPWKRIMRDVTTGQATGAVTCSNVTSRQDDVELSSKISSTRVAMVTRRDYTGPTLQNVEDMRGLKVITIDGYATQKELKEKKIEHTTVNSIEQALDFLMHRDQDVFYIGWESGAYAAKLLNYRSKLNFLTVADQDNHPFYVCFSKKWPNHSQLVAQFNHGLERIRHAGIIDNIYARYGLVHDS